jgi:hypothetical protein
VQFSMKIFSCSSVADWDNWRVRFPMSSLDFSIELMLPAALWPSVLLSL